MQTGQLHDDSAREPIGEGLQAIALLGDPVVVVAGHQFAAIDIARSAHPMFEGMPLEVDSIAATLQRHRIDGAIATNTTTSRAAVHGLAHAQETGGLSGAPVFDLSNRVIRRLRAALGKSFPIIGVGGILSAQDARAKIEAGADLVQIYTGLIYQGPELVRQAALAIRGMR